MKAKIKKAPAGAAARMKKITAEAKKIRAKSPRKAWTSCVKEASKKLF